MFSYVGCRDTYLTQLTQVIYVFLRWLWRYIFNSADSGDLCFPTLAMEIHI